jgi:hypothetical protein
MMAEIVELRKAVCENELEETIHAAFLKRQDLMRKLPIMDERITRIDMWLIQQKLPLDILIAIWSRAQFCSWVFYGDAEPEVKHTMLLRLRSHYLEFCQLPPRLQKKLWPMGWERWHAQFIEEEEMEAAKNATA